MNMGIMASPRAIFDAFAGVGRAVTSAASAAWTHVSAGVSRLFSCFSSTPRDGVSLENRRASVASVDPIPYVLGSSAGANVSGQGVTASDFRLPGSSAVPPSSRVDQEGTAIRFHDTKSHTSATSGAGSGPQIPGGPVPVILGSDDHGILCKKWLVDYVEENLAARTNLTQDDGFRGDGQAISDSSFVIVRPGYDGKHEEVPRTTKALPAISAYFREVSRLDHAMKPFVPTSSAPVRPAEDVAEMTGFLRGVTSLLKKEPSDLLSEEACQQLRELGAAVSYLGVDGGASLFVSKMFALRVFAGAAGDAVSAAGGDPKKSSKYNLLCTSLQKGTVTLKALGAGSADLISANGPEALAFNEAFSEASTALRGFTEKLGHPAPLARDAKHTG